MFFFQMGIEQDKGPAKSLPTVVQITLNESFQMKYCINLYLKGHQKYERSKLKRFNLLTKYVDLFYFQYPFRHRIKHLKALIMVGKV